MKNKNKVSIIIPCYNQGKFLDAALLSVYNQSYSNWECIIINDGYLFDETESIATSWSKKDSRFHYIYKENGGVSSARNRGLSEMNGDFILFLDSDDCIHKDKLLKSIQLFEKGDADIVISNFKRFKSNLSNLRPAFCDLSKQEFNLKSILLNWDSSFNIPIHCGVFRSQLFNTVRFEEKLKAQEDWFMWISVFEQKPKAIFLDEVLVYYRTNNPGSMTKNLKKWRQNNDKAYMSIVARLDKNMKQLFLQKVFEDNTNTVFYYYKKQLKYKNYFYYLLFITIILIILLIFSLF